MGCTGEKGFTATLDAAQDYLALQASLSAALRAGFLSLAQARYSMGPDRVSAVQFPSHMRATARLRAADDGELVLEITDPTHPLPAAGSGAESPPEPSSPASSGSGSGSWAKAEADDTPAAAKAGAANASSSSSSSMPAATRGPAGSSGGGGAAPPSGQASQAGGSNAGSGSAAAARASSATGAGAEVEEQLLRLRLAADHSGDFMQQLAAKYGCSEGAAGGHTDAGLAPAGNGGAGHGSGVVDEGGGEDDEYDEVAPPGRPLAWFGSLVAPSLRDAEAHFSAALALAVQAANAQRRLSSGLGSCQQGAAAERVASGSSVVSNL